MARPTFLVAETEPGSAISARKLVLETAKFNVVTAHSKAEALEFFELAPALYAALIVSTDLPGAASVLAKIKRAEPDCVVICLSPNRSTSLRGADHHCSSHDPQGLVELCRRLFGDPR
jgi:DNA-binding response OmpR family regulator